MTNKQPENKKTENDDDDRSYMNKINECKRLNKQTKQLKNVVYIKNPWLSCPKHIQNSFDYLLAIYVVIVVGAFLIQNKVK